MNTITEDYKGYTITITQDESPENPFEAWDLEPGLITYYGGRHGYAKSYQGAPESIGEVLNLLPACCFERGERVRLIREHLNCTLREFAEALRENHTWSELGSVENFCEVFESFLNEQVGNQPEGWRDAVAWFEMVESLLTFGGIACVNTESRGYTQGDSTLVLALATPEFLEKSGVLAENVTGCLKSAVELYSAWVWGDVYGIDSIISPDGEDLEDASVWGFYGSDNEESGLMESARDSIDYHIRQLAETALNEPACLI